MSLIEQTEQPVSTDQTPAPQGHEGQSGAGEQAVERPEYVPEAYWDADKKSVKAEDAFKALTELQGKLDARAGGVPKDVAEYAIEAPEGFEIDANDPLLASARATALELGLTKDEFAKFGAVYVQHQAAEQAAFKDRMAKEKALLGDKADARVKAVQDALTAKLGKETAEALSNLIVSAKIVTGLEKLLTPPGGSFSQAGREVEKAGEIPGFEKMTMIQQLAALDQLKSRTA